MRVLAGQLLKAFLCGLHSYACIESMHHDLRVQSFAMAKLFAACVVHFPTASRNMVEAADKMENELKSIIATNNVPAELTITYNDMHGLWGGTIITVRGNGSVERQTKEMGAPEVRISQLKIDERELVALIRLLVELRAWEQRTADEQPVADESRAHLTISLKHGASRVWARVNEMAANNRLVQIKTQLEKLSCG